LRFTREIPRRRSKHEKTKDRIRVSPPGQEGEKGKKKVRHLVKSRRSEEKKRNEHSKEGGEGKNCKRRKKGL